MRSALWSIGFYGSTNEGFESMNKTPIIKTIIDMSLNCETLSLRGTCRYILNMFCHCEKGRQILSCNGFYVDRKSFAAYPIKINEFFQISLGEVEHYCENEEFWKTYE